MADRAVRQVGKDQTGNIISLADSGQPWSPRSSEDCVRDIETRTHSYHVPWLRGHTEIQVAKDASGRYLRTDRDDTMVNNLEDLPQPMRSETERGPQVNRISSLKLPSWLLVSVMLILGVVVPGWMLLPVSWEASCIPHGLKLPQAVTAVIIATVIAMMCGFFVGRRHRNLAIALAVAGLMFAGVAGAVGAFWSGDSYFPEVVAARELCGRSVADAKIWGWLVGLPTAGMAFTTAAGALKGIWGWVVASIVALTVCGSVIVVFAT